MRHCPKCGTENTDDRATCHACAASLENEQEKKEEAQGPVGSLPEGPLSIASNEAPAAPPPADAAPPTFIPPPTPPLPPMPGSVTTEAPRTPAMTPPPARVTLPPSPSTSMPPPPPGMNAPPTAYPATGMAAQTTPAATWALVTGILSILCCAPAGIAAIVLAQQAKRETPANQGMAQTGLVFGIIGLAIWGLVLLVYLAIFIFAIASSI